MRMINSYDFRFVTKSINCRFLFYYNESVKLNMHVNINTWCDKAKRDTYRITYLSFEQLVFSRKCGIVV